MFKYFRILETHNTILTLIIWEQGLQILWHYRAGGCRVLVLKNVNISRFDHVCMQGRANEGQ
jgi:hypothetical protein